MDKNLKGEVAIMDGMGIKPNYAALVALYVGFTEIEDAVIMNINIVSEIYFLNSSMEH